ncbi:hypothetical protein MLD38_019197 [Melastoma candidum]|uniref:Uncharacterized protein n=1 Tax=Melastoma candidum TaxID=119954 RepID=A0ACB9QY50_9MYRT|nr:hypothetical protein MLD38_019197 [Melastoma candidum]
MTSGVVVVASGRIPPSPLPTLLQPSGTVALASSARMFTVPTTLTIHVSEQGAFWLATSLKGSCVMSCPSFTYTHGANGIATGSLSRDTIRLHGRNPNVIREVPRFIFVSLGSTHHEPIGIAGFGRGMLWIPSLLGFLHKGFSHSFLGFKYANKPNYSSPLVVDDAALSSKETMQSTPKLQSSMYPNY